MGVLRCLIRGLVRRRSTRRAEVGGRGNNRKSVEALLIDLGLLGLVLAEFEALKFSGRGFGEFVKELDPARAFVASDTVRDKILQFAGQLVLGCEFRFQHDVGCGFGEARFVMARDNRGFEHCWVRDQSAFDFGGA